MTTKVTLRQKTISKGRKSLYLDFYPAIAHPKTGKLTRREFLGIYIFEDKKEVRKEIKDLKERINNREIEKKRLIKKQEYYKNLKELTPFDKQHNTEMLKLAESIRQKRQNILNKPEIYNQYEKEQLRIKELGEKNFIDYFEKLENKRKNSNHNNWASALKYLKTFADGNIKFKDLNEKFFENFKEYLLTTKSNRSNKTRLSTNSAVSYFNKVKATLKQAYKDGILQTDLNAKIQPIKAAETSRDHLTLAELNKLVKTPCNNMLLKRAALFSALSGLRFSDIKKMVWSELEYVEEQGYFINFRQKKTKGIEVLPISDQAYSFTEGTENPKDMPQDKQVFEGLKYSAYQNKHLFQWIGAAGITKNITFHNFRHTYAVLQLYNGTDIYTVSKMLGHKNLKTTQIYAKIVSETKRKAANKINLDM